MGHWNETCFLTHLPIFPRNDVVLLIVAHTEGIAGQNYYYDDDGMPIALPIYGKYDEYGGIEDYSMSPLTKQLLTTVPFYTFTRNEYVKMDAELDDLIPAICEGGVFIKHPFVTGNLKCEYTPLSTVMYHRGVYEEIVQEMTTRKPANRNQGYKSVQIAELTQNWEKNLARYNKDQDLLKKLQSSVAKHVEDENYVMPDFVSQLTSSPTPIWGHINSHYQFVSEYEKLLYKNPEMATDFINELADSICFFVGLDLMRRSFFGGAGKGSQNEEMYLHKLVAEWSLKFIQSKLSEQKNPNENMLRTKLYL